MLKKLDYLFPFDAFVSSLASASLWFLVNREDGVFFSLGVPSILSLWVGVRLTIHVRATKLKS